MENIHNQGIYGYIAIKEIYVYSIEPHIGWDDQLLRTVQHVHE